MTAPNSSHESVPTGIAERVPEAVECTHRYLTTYGKGWVCANRRCGVGILSLAVPLPLPLVAAALRAISGSQQ